MLINTSTRMRALLAACQSAMSAAGFVPSANAAVTAYKARNDVRGTQGAHDAWGPPVTP
jgi:hypothetical protein